MDRSGSSPLIVATILPWGRDGSPTGHGRSLGPVDNAREEATIDLLAARKPLLQAEQQLAAVRSQRYAAAIDLDQALGGGIAATAPAPIASH